MNTLSGTSAAAHYDSFAEYYDIWTSLMPVTTVDAPFYVELAETLPGETLVELGVGTGRVAEAMAAVGASVIGIDASSEMLARAATRLEIAGVADRVRLVEGDFLTWAPNEPVAAVYSPYHTLSHLLTLPDWVRLFDVVHGYLRSGGQFRFNVSNADWDALCSTHGRWQEIGRFDLLGGDAVVEVCNRFERDDRLHHVEVHGTLHADGALVLDRRWEFSLRLPSIDEIESLAAAAGFEVVDLSGSFTERGRPVVYEQNWILRSRP